MRSFTWEQVRRTRMARSFLSERTDSSPEQIAADLAGIHAQVMSAAETSIGLRSTNLKSDDVRAALWERRSLVKTWTLRGTLHLHSSEELPVWLSARSAVSGGFHPSALRNYGVTESQAEKMTEAVRDVLDGACLSRKELADAVAELIGPWAREPLMSGWGTMLGLATIRGWLCHGPPSGNTVTFARSDQWVRKWRSVPADEALRWVARRYIELFGPVTHGSFHAWFTGPSFKVSHARAIFDDLRDEIEQVEVEGKKMWTMKDAALGEPAPPAARLLPLYDCYLVGFREREQILTERAGAFAKTHPKGKLEGPVAVQWLLADGRIKGTWTRSLSPAKVQVTVKPFVGLSGPLRKAITREAEHLAGFWGKSLELSFDT